MTFESSFRDLDLHNVCKMARNTMNNNHIMCLQRRLLLYMSKNTKTTYRKTIWKLSFTFHCTNIFSFDLNKVRLLSELSGSSSKCFPREHQRNEIALINRHWSRRALSRWTLKHKNAPVEVAFRLVSVLFRQNKSSVRTFSQSLNAKIRNLSLHSMHLLKNLVFFRYSNWPLK